MTACATSRPLRVLTVAESFFLDHRNGLARVAWDVSRGLAERGHEVTLLAPGPVAGGEPVTESIAGVRVRRFPRSRASAWNPWNPGVHVAAHVAAIRSLGAAGPWDGVLCHGVCGTVAAGRVFGGDVPVVMTVHSPAVDEQRWNWTHGRPWDVLKLAGLPVIAAWEAEAFRSADRWVSLSGWTRDRVQAIHRFTRAGPWTVIPHWSEPSWRRSLGMTQARQRLGWPLDEPVLLAVRQLRSRYGLDVAIRALAQPVLGRGCRLRLVGDGPVRAGLARLAARLGVADRVSFAGGIDDDALQLHYQAADLCLVPSLALECFGLITLEALGFGVPVVATRVGGLTEILDPILPDLVVPPADPAALAGAAARVLGDTGAVPSGSRLVDYVDRRFGKRATLEAYEWLLGGAAPSVAGLAGDAG